MASKHDLWTQRDVLQEFCTVSSIVAKHGLFFKLRTRKSWCNLLCFLNAQSLLFPLSSEKKKKEEQNHYMILEFPQGPVTTLFLQCLEWRL